MRAIARAMAWLGGAVVLAVVPATVPAAAGGAQDVHRRATAQSLAQHVVLFAFDGFDARYLERGIATPHLDELARHGSLTTATGVMTSITSPGWTSIDSGAYPERTLNTAYWYDAAADLAHGQSRESAVETLGEVLRAEGRTVAAVQWFVERGRGVAYRDPAGLYTQPGGRCARRADSAVALLRGQAVQSDQVWVQAPKVPDLLVLYCNDLDTIGHRYGADGWRIARAVRLLDEQVGRVVRATKAAGIFASTTFVMTSDHGMGTVERTFGDRILAAIARSGHRGAFVRPGDHLAPGADVALVEGGVASLHLVGDGWQDPQAVAGLVAALKTVPQIAHIYDRGWQAALHMSPRMGDLVLEPMAGWSVSPLPPPHRFGQHGTSRERAVPLLLSGAGIVAGRPPHDALQVDVAPTIAALLGVRAPSGAQGRVLVEALAGP